MHQSGSRVYPTQVTNRNIGVGAADPPSGCGGTIPQFLCLSPLGDTDYHWLHAIEEGFPTAPAYWKPLPGGVTDAAVGREGSIWVLGTAIVGAGYQIFHADGSGYQLIDGAVVRIAVGPDATVYGTASDGSIWRRIGGVSGTWQSMGCCAIDIAAGGDGSVWIVGSGSSNSVWYWTGSGWAAIDGAVAHIAVGGDGTVYGAAADGSVWQRPGGVSGSWQALGGCAVDIGVGSMSPFLWVLGCGSVSGGWGIYYWGGSGWFAIDGGAVDIAVDHAGWPYIANSSAMFQRRQ